MATRSRIAIENQDRTISSIYCHWDGYPEGVGATLKDHYSDSKKLQQLIDLGDISSLDNTTSTTVAYHRDRGESLNKARVNRSLDAFRNSDYEQYGYVFTLDNQWNIFS